MRTLIHSLAMILALGLAACQTTMSLEEAKQATATGAGQTFVPPPRTLTDVRALIGPVYGPPRNIPGSNAEFDRADPVAAGKAYHARGRAARRVGQFRQALADLKAAAELITPRSGVQEDLPYPSNQGIAILRDLAETEATSGDYWNAIKTYELALIDREGGQGWTALRMGLGELYARTGDLKAAERTFTDLERNAQGVRRRWPLHQAEIDSALPASRAILAQAEGRLRDAEKFWRQSIQALEEDRARALGFLSERHAARVSRLAECLLGQGRFLEAELEARRSLRLRASRADNAYDHLSVVTLLARIMRAQGRYADSEALARMAIHLYADGGASPASSVSVIAPRLDLAAVLAAQGQWSQALEEYRAARRDLADDPLWERLTGADPAFLHSMLTAGELPEAVAALDRALAEAQRSRGADHSTTAELQGLRAIAHAAVGDRTRALEGFRLAARVLLNQHSERDDEMTTEGEQEQRIRFIFAGYVTLLAEVGDTNPPFGLDAPSEAFRVADATHVRSVQRALNASTARAAARSPELADLVRREQDATKQIAALQGLLVTLLSGPGNSRAEADLRARIENLRQARQTLTQHVAKELPTYAQLVDPAPVTIEQTRTALRPGEALIETLVTEEKTYIWAVQRAGALAFATAPIGEKGLAVLVRRLRVALDFHAGTMGDIPMFDVEAAHELYRVLLEPVRNGWNGAEALMIVAHGALGQIPFALLVTTPINLEPDHVPLFSQYRTVPWLTRQYAVTTLPSVSALTTLRSGAAASVERRPFVGFGDPYFTERQAQQGERTADAMAQSQASRIDIEPRSLPTRFRDVVVSPGREVETSQLDMLPRLPDTRDEILSVAKAMGADLERDVFLGRAANEHAVKTLDLTRYRVIAFATHGLLPGDLDGLTQPALALTAPAVARVEGDGLLTMEEILALRLNADWVVLSACNTANADAPGAEAFSGLGRAFFYAGARALLVTHWPVETRSARALMIELFRRQTDSRAKLLQQTMNWMIDDGGVIDPESGKLMFSYAHPIFWAPFTLVGDGG